MFIQFFIIAFAFFAFSRIILNFKKGRMTLKGLIFWSGLWLAVIVTALFPQITNPLARFLGVGRGSDLSYLSFYSTYFLPSL